MKRIIERLIGRRYWIVTYGRMQMGDNVWVCDKIFLTEEEAIAHYRELRYGTKIIRPIRVESFRSREDYGGCSDD